MVTWRRWPAENPSRKLHPKTSEEEKRLVYGTSASAARCPTHLPHEHAHVLSSTGRVQSSGCKPMSSPQFSVTRRCVPDATPPHRASCWLPASGRGECCNFRTGLPCSNVVRAVRGWSHSTLFFFLGLNFCIRPVFVLLFFTKVNS